jgi:hypothetical protein
MGFGSALMYGLGSASKNIQEIQEQKKQDALDLIQQQLIQQQIQNAIFAGKEAKAQAGRAEKDYAYREQLRSPQGMMDTALMKPDTTSDIGTLLLNKSAAAGSEPTDADIDRVTRMMDKDNAFRREGKTDKDLARRKVDTGIRADESTIKREEAALAKLLGPPSELDILNITADTAAAKAKLAKAEKELAAMSADMQDALINEVLNTYPVDPETFELTEAGSTRLLRLKSAAEMSGKQSDVKYVNGLEAAVEIVKSEMRKAALDQAQAGPAVDAPPQIIPERPAPSVTGGSAFIGAGGQGGIGLSDIGNFFKENFSGPPVPGMQPTAAPLADSTMATSRVDTSATNQFNGAPADSFNIGTPAVEQAPGGMPANVATQENVLAKRPIMPRQEPLPRGQNMIPIQGNSGGIPPMDGAPNAPADPLRIGGGYPFPGNISAGVNPPDFAVKRMVQEFNKIISSGAAGVTGTISPQSRQIISEGIKQLKSMDINMINPQDKQIIQEGMRLLKERIGNSPAVNNLRQDSNIIGEGISRIFQ